MTALILLLPLVIYLPVVVLLHRFGQARAERRAQRRLPTQGITLKAVFLALFFVLVALGLGCGTGKISAAWGLWAAVVAGCVGYCYWLLVCLTESGRRYMITELIAANPGITPAEIVRRYNRHQIIAARLERLEHWGTLGQQGDRYHSRPNSMLAASVLVRGWAQILGFAWPRLFKKESSHQ